VSIRNNGNHTATPGMSRGADKAAQNQKDAARRVEAQRVASLQMTAKIQRLRALRLERDAQEALRLAEAPAAVPAKTGKRKSSAATDSAKP
jgi:hypothetical protein